MRAERAAAILDFLAVADRLKTVERRGRVVLPGGATRRENSADHCRSPALIGRPNDRAEDAALLGPAA